MSTHRHDVWIVIAAYNEASRIKQTLNDLTRDDWNLVVVDDGSSDQTSAIASSMGVNVLRHIINRGQGAAIQTGIDFAISQGAQRIVTFDADGQHSAANIPAMLQRLDHDQLDIVLGSRFLGQAIGIPLHRKLLLKAAVWFTRITTRLQLTDTHNGLRAMTRKTAIAIRIHEDRMAHASEILHEVSRLRLRYAEYPVCIKYHDETLAKGQRSRDAWGVLGRLMISRLFT